MDKKTRVALENEYIFLIQEEEKIAERKREVLKKYWGSKK